MSNKTIDKKTNIERSKAIIQWLSDHPLINRHALCGMVGYDSGNLSKSFDGTRNIPSKYLDSFEQYLGKYGYRK